MMDGFLLVDKPAGWTSHDVVAKVRRILSKRVGKKVKVGHAGTLDPMATGLLIILVGGYTKRASVFLKLDKTYECELTLGEISTTGDAAGVIRTQDTGNRTQPAREEVEKIIKGFIGTIKQVPPAYSAIKIKGQAAYKLARAGQQLKMEPRIVTIYDLRSTKYEYPKLYFTARVSSGTYIRSLAQDVGAKLGTGAYLSALRRTKIDQFDIKDSYTLDKIAKALPEHL